MIETLPTIESLRTTEARNLLVRDHLASRKSPVEYATDVATSFAEAPLQRSAQGFADLCAGIDVTDDQKRRNRISIVIGSALAYKVIDARFPALTLLDPAPEEDIEATKEGVEIADLRRRIVSYEAILEYGKHGVVHTLIEQWFVHSEVEIGLVGFGYGHMMAIATRTWDSLPDLATMARHAEMNVYDLNAELQRIIQRTQ